MMLSQNSVVFILFGIVTCGEKLWVVPKSYVILCNSGGRLDYLILQLFEKLMDLKNLKL